MAQAGCARRVEQQVRGQAGPKNNNHAQAAHQTNRHLEWSSDQPGTDKKPPSHSSGNALPAQRRAGAAQTEHASVLEHEGQPIRRYQVFYPRAWQPPHFPAGPLETLEHFRFLVRGHRLAFPTIRRVEATQLDCPPPVYGEVATPRTAALGEGARLVAPVQQM